MASRRGKEVSELVAPFTKAWGGTQVPFSPVSRIPHKARPHLSWHSLSTKDPGSTRRKLSCPVQWEQNVLKQGTGSGGQKRTEKPRQGQCLAGARSVL